MKILNHCDIDKEYYKSDIYFHYKKIIHDLKRTRCKEDIGRLLEENIELFPKLNSLYCLFVDKKSYDTLHEINIKFPNNHLSCFKPVMKECSKASWQDDEIFESACNQNQEKWIAISHGLSLNYENNSCFLCLPKNEHEREEIIARAKLLIPYLHMAFNNSQQREAQDLFCSLSNRQKEIVNYMSRGKTNRQMAIMLGLSEFTVKNHVAAIYSKLNVVNRVQAVDFLNKANF